MLAKKLFSIFVAASVGGGVLAAPAQAAPTGSSLVDRVEKKEVPGPLTEHRYHVYAGVPVTMAPLKPNLPAGTTLALEEGPELERLKRLGWSLALTDNVMAVTPSINAEGYCAVPAIITHPDGSDESVDIIMYVDFPLDIDFLGSAFGLLSSDAGPQGWLC